jgi:hypothetical protein
MFGRYPILSAGIVLGLFVSAPALALDKQGSGQARHTDVLESGQRVSGGALFGVAVFNPSYAARPDNTGLALFRVAGHTDIDLIGQHLTIPLDVNIFTDRTTDGANILVPSELDLIGGVASTWALGKGALELGVRGEIDLGVDRATLSQGYVDSRAKYSFESDDFNSLHKILGRNHFSSSTTLGVFGYNPSYAARPDNTGLALLRYAERLGFSRDWFSAALDFTFFTDRNANAIAPSELDFTVDIGATSGAVGMHLAYERDMPVDQGSLVQHFVFVYLTLSFAHDLSSLAATESAPGH